MTVRERKIIDHDEWMKWREPNINASEAGALFAIDLYTSPLALYHRKKKTVPLDEENDAMRRGRWLEPAVLKATAELRPDLEISEPKCYFDDPALRVGCTPDAFAVEKKSRRIGVIQPKTVGENVFKDWMASGNLETPLAYELQTMIEAVQTLRPDFALIGLMIVSWRVDMRIISVPIVGKTWEAFLKRVKRFWIDFEKGVAPPVSGLDGDLVRKLYPGKPGATIDLSSNNRLPELLEKHDELAAALKAGRAPLKPLERDYEAIRTEVRGFMGDAEFATLPCGKTATLKP